MAFFTGLSKAIMLVFNVVIGLVAIAGIAGSIYCFASVLIHHFAQNTVLACFLAAFVVLLIYSVAGCRSMSVEHKGTLICYSIFTFLLFGCAIALGAYLSGYVVHVGDLSKGFSVSGSTVSRDDAVKSIFESFYKTFNTLYSDGKCTGGGVLRPNPTSSKFSKDIQWSDVQCSDSGIESALKGLQKNPENQDEYNQWMHCMDEEGFPRGTNYASSAAQEAGLWCRANTKVASDIEKVTRILMIGSWVVSGVLLLVLICGCVLFHQKRRQQVNREGPVQQPAAKGPVQVTVQNGGTAKNVSVQQGQTAVVYV